MKKVCIIAEAGVNHNGNADLAFQLIDTAANAGVDAIKFQTYKAENLLTEYASKASYQIKNSIGIETQYDMLKKLQLPFSLFVDLKK